MAIMGFPLFAFMLLIARGLSPSRLPGGDDRLAAVQERFRRLGVKWLSGPEDTTGDDRLTRRRRR